MNISNKYSGMQEDLKMLGNQYTYAVSIISSSAMNPSKCF